MCVCGWWEGTAVCYLAMVLGNFQCRGFRLICIKVGQEPSVLAEGAGQDCYCYHISLWEIVSKSR